MPTGLEPGERVQSEALDDALLIEATEAGSLAGTSESARIRMSIQARLVSKLITR
jgi:hypothetical protein